MAHIPENVKKKYQNMEKYSNLTQRECDVMNATPGNLKDYDCPDCLNRGCIYHADGDYIIAKECHCMVIRQSIKNIERSGIKGLLKQCTFENFTATEPWQKRIKEKAQQFLNNHNGKWFYAGGQVGCGKTHICTAICGEFLKQKKAVRYMLWRDEVVKLKAVVNDDTEYARLINPLKSAPVLYVDDFFKTSDTEDGGKKKPTQGDINVAFEILNYRYINPNLITIISSERSIDDLIDCDEAVGSRIYQRTKNYCCYIGTGKNRNYRLR